MLNAPETWMFGSLGVYFLVSETKAMLLMVECINRGVSISPPRKHDYQTNQSMHISRNALLSSFLSSMILKNELQG